jgi:virulence factor Mce-like protein
MVRRSPAGSRVLLLTGAVTAFAVLAAFGLWWLFGSPTSNRVTAYFSAAVGVYPNTDVRVLGVKVGTVESVTPQGTQVRVVLDVDRSVPVPAAVYAVQVAPSVVADRYVQLAPAYTGGPRLADNAVIPREHTAVPAELDELYQSVNKLTAALGPGGANSDGALSNLITTGAANLSGNGQAIADTIRNLSQTAGTLAGHREDLYGTVDSLQRFVSTLAAGDDQVRRLNTQLATVTGFLAGEREDLGAALAQLSTALGTVASFIQDNRAALRADVAELTSVSGVLVQQRAALAEVLDTAPLALSNIANSYNAGSGTLDARPDIMELANTPLGLLCGLVQTGTTGGLPAGFGPVCQQVRALIEGNQPATSLASVLTQLRIDQLPPIPGLALPTVPPGG